MLLFVADIEAINFELKNRKRKRQVKKVHLSHLVLQGADIRKNYINRLADAFNAADFEHLSDLMNDIFLSECHFYHDLIGSSVPQSLFPAKLRMIGTSVAVQYYLHLMQCMPDIVVTVQDRSIRTNGFNCILTAALKFDATVVSRITISEPKDIPSITNNSSSIYDDGSLFSTPQLSAEDEQNEMHSIKDKFNDRAMFGSEQNRVVINHTNQLKIRPFDASYASSASSVADSISSSSSTSSSFSSSSLPTNLNGGGVEDLPPPPPTGLRLNTRAISNGRFTILPKIHGTFTVRMDLTPQNKVSRLRVEYAIGP